MITSLRLQNFRSYKDSSFEFEPGVNIIVGPNAAGKTNLLEAVLALSRGGSYKAKDAELIKHGRPWARLDGVFENHSRTLKLELKDQILTKTFQIDGKPFSRLNLERSIPVVFFEPNHLQLITRGPAQRREYIDELLERVHPGLKPTLAAYQRALAQRNALLKRGQDHAAQQIFAWDVRLGELGSQIALARQQLINDFNSRLSKTYNQIAQTKTKATIEYNSHFPVEHYASRLVSKLEKSLPEDLARGFTSSGPHREDFSFYLGSRLLSSTASRGETRSLLLALKTLELTQVEKTRAQKPLLLLDDVFSELDGSRRQALVELLKNHQSILTTTDADAVLGYFAGGPHNLLALD